MSKELRIAVVGAGRISTAHLESIGGMRDRIRLIAVADIDEKNAREKAVRYGAEKGSCTPEAAFADRDVEAVILCVPHGLHCALAIEAMRSYKHVLVEKPLALTLADADEMIRTSRENGTVLMVAQSRRFYKAVLNSKQYLSEIGEPFNVIGIWNVCVRKPSTSWWLNPEMVGRGFLADLNGPHVMDYVLWVIRDKACRVHALGYQNNREWNGPDEVCISVKFLQGGIATVHVSFNTVPEINEKIVTGPKGTMRIINDSEIWVNGDLKEKYPEEKDYLKGGSNFILQIDEFRNAIKDGKPPLTSGEECRRVVEVIAAARESLFSGRIVEL